MSTSSGSSYPRQKGVDEKRRLILASGDYPDVFYGVTLTRDELLTYGSQGALIRLNDLIDKHGFEVKSYRKV